MKTFNIDIVRIARQFKTISVQANSQEQAEKLALEQAGDYEFPGEKSADYQLADQPPLEDDIHHGAMGIFFSGDNPVVEFEKLTRAQEMGLGKEQAGTHANVWYPFDGMDIDELVENIELHIQTLSALVDKARLV